MQELINKIDNCLDFIETSHRVLQEIEKSTKGLEEQNQTLVNFSKDLITSLDFYKKGVDILYEKTIKSLEEQLTSLMQEVFTGCNYGIHFEIEDLRGAKNLIIEFFDDNFQGDPDDLGGSLETIVGYLFHLIYLIKSGKPRILFMDELFKDVNNEYLLNLIELISKLTKSTNSINVLITHQEDIESVVENTYIVKSGNYELHSSKV